MTQPTLSDFAADPVGVFVQTHLTPAKTKDGLAKQYLAAVVPGGPLHDAAVALIEQIVALRLPGLRVRAETTGLHDGEAVLRDEAWEQTLEDLESCCEAEAEALYRDRYGK
jgi:hypothetical protein